MDLATRKRGRAPKHPKPGGSWWTSKARRTSKAWWQVDFLFSSQLWMSPHVRTRGRPWKHLKSSAMWTSGLAHQTASKHLVPRKRRRPCKHPPTGSPGSRSTSAHHTACGVGNNSSIGPEGPANVERASLVMRSHLQPHFTEELQAYKDALQECEETHKFISGSLGRQLSAMRRAYEGPQKGGTKTVQARVLNLMGGTEAGTTTLKSLSCFGPRSRELTGAEDLLAHYGLRNLSIADSSYFQQVVGDIEIRKGEGMEFGQLIAGSYNRAVNIQTFDLQSLQRAFTLKETGTISLPEANKGLQIIIGNPKVVRDKEHKKKHQTHKHREKDNFKKDKDKGHGIGEIDEDRSKKHRKNKRRCEEAGEEADGLKQKKKKPVHGVDSV